ncbi:hypothetical protein PENFLA_c018G05303 [Penicillium flavigenum]|uniref:Probable succinyl-diaminopimelate desuccinylase n=1 Tax=Penicillium flavigenum TaxID=254877 RepID=A0A1V6T054_9EURO|nr:hypothetical protein PENFLA_c018G05303 [Penicillium flavigenum]
MDGLQYTTKHDVTIDDVVSLTQTMVQIDSSTPGSGSNTAGETTVAQYICAWLQHRNIECHWIEETPGRPSVIGVVRGSGDGKALMFNGHTDTVTLQGYDGDPLSGHIANGRLYGRGSADMKSGMAAAMIATASAAKLNLRGDVILAAVADEECDSIGTEQVLAAGWRADAAIVAEPTDFAIINAHKGYVLLEVDIHGVAAHGSRPDLGVDAICKAGYFLVELDRYAQSLPQRSPTGVEIDAPNVHVGIIRGGAEINSYPAKCTISIERRTVAGETSTSVENELRPILEKLASTVSDFTFELRTTSYRPPYSIASDHPFVNLVVEHAVKTTGMAPPIKSETYWTDMALLSEAGIPGVIWGPKGCGLHSKEESVEVESIRQLADSFIAIAASYCQG